MNLANLLSFACAVTNKGIFLKIAIAKCRLNLEGEMVHDQAPAAKRIKLEGMQILNKSRLTIVL